MRVSIDPAALDAIFAGLDRTDRPGMAVGVAQRGAPIYRRGFGLSSVELPVALTPSARLRIGSATKHFACLCVMLLAEDSMLSASDSVRRWLPELQPWAEGVTLARLMCHTGGVRCSLDLLDTFSDIMGKPLSAQAQLDLLIGLESVNFAPGEDWLYSNGGYVLLNAVIARASGRSFAEVVTERVLRPAGLHDTEVRPVDTDLRPNSATLHLPRPGGGYDRAVFGPEIAGEGAIVSTVDDMLRWLAHMRAPTVGSPETWRAMQEPVRLADARSTGYGLGLFVGEYRGVRTIHHGGRVPGGACQMLTLPDHDLDVVVLTNADDVPAWPFAWRIVDACVEGLEPAPEPLAGAFPTGEFLSPRTARYTRLVPYDGGVALAEGAARTPLTRRSDGEVGFRSRFAAWTSLAADGADLVWTDLGAPDPLTPLPPAPARPLPPGRYRCAEAQADAEVTDGDPQVFHAAGPYGRASYTLSPRGGDVWLAAVGEGPPMVLECRDEALLFTSSRVRRLRFVPA